MNRTLTLEEEIKFFITYKRDTLKTVSMENESFKEVV